MSPWEEEAARRHVEYYARRSECSRGRRAYNQNRSGRIKRPQFARDNRIPVLESPPPLPREIRNPVNDQHRAPCRVVRNVRDNHHTKQQVQNGSNENASVARADPIGVPSNPSKRPINSVGLNEEIELAKKRTPSSEDVRYRAHIPGQTELNRLLSQLTPVQRARHTNMVQAASFRAAKAMKEYLAKD